MIIADLASKRLGRSIITSSQYTLERTDMSCLLVTWFLWFLFRSRYSALSASERKQYCEWWWNDANRRMIREGLTKQQIREATSKANTALRPGCADLIRQCMQLGVPFVIVSAGFTDVIEGLLERYICRPLVPASHCIVIKTVACFRCDVMNRGPFLCIFPSCFY
jgi:hypothetical protein